MNDYIKAPAPKTKKGTKTMSDKKALELPPAPEPKTIKLAIRVKTLMIVLALLTSHGLVFWAGLKAPSLYDSFVDGLVKTRTAETTPIEVSAKAPASKANQ